MRKTIRQITSIVLALLITAADPVYAKAQVDATVQQEESLGEDELQEEVASDEDLKEDLPVFTEDENEDENEVEIEDENDEDEIVTGYNYIPGEGDVESIAVYADDADDSLMSIDEADPLPASYTTLSLPDLRNQSPYGTCWAHSAMATAEISMMKQGLIPSADFSELHLAYFSYYTPVDPTGRMNGDRNSAIYSGKKKNFLERGGNLSYASNILANWIGAAAEETAPYSSAETALSEHLPDSIAYTDAAHLKNFYSVNTSTDEDRNAIKRIVRDLGAVGVSFYVPESNTLIDTYYNEEHNSFYYSKSTSETNHAVTVVGWDDDFSKDNFNKTAPADGAWLIRNSWYDEGDDPYSFDGYFWMSYYDKGLANSAAWGFEYEEEDAYDHIYQYDGGMETFYPYLSSSDTIREANVFTVDLSAGREVLEAVSFVTRNTNVNYTVDVYVDLTEENDPVSGTKVSTVNGSTTYVGYYTAKLDRVVELAPGEKFSVVVTLSKSGDNLKYSTEYSDSSDWYRTTVKARPGESFISKQRNGSWTEWEDTSSVSNVGNVRIKAFTTNDPGTFPTVTFDGNGGTFDGQTTIEKHIKEGKPYGTFPEPTRPGYDIEGWYTQPVGGEKIVSTDIVEGDIALYAHWVGKIYSVRCILEDGSVFFQKNVRYMSTYGELPSPEWEGHIFNGWFTDASGGQKITADSIVTQRSSHMLFAHWSLGNYKITFEPNGGSCTESYRMRKYGEAYGELPETSRENYTFQGWYDQNRGGKKIEADTIVEKDRDHSLYARWKGNNVKVTFDYNDGTGRKATQSVSFGGCYISFPYVTRIGYDLDGWFTDPVAGVEVKSSDVVTDPSPQTLYAHWSTAKYTLTMNANGGKFPDGSQTQTKELEYGKPYGILPTPVWTKNFFLGWFTAKEGGDEVTKDTIVTEMKNVSVYAHWEEDKNIYVTVTFDENGGGALPVEKKSKTVIYQKEYGELPVPAAPEGMEFDGWYTSRTGQGSHVTENSIVAAKKDFSLFARWKVKKCRATFDANGGIFDNDSLKVTFSKDWGSDCTLSDIAPYGNPSYGHHKFDKWYADSDCTDPYDFSQKIKSDTVIYAGWTEVPGGFVVEGLEDSYTYTGSAITPKITVYDNDVNPDRPLTEGTDYSITYKNNINVGDASSKDKPTILLTGKGKYQKNRSVYFTIGKASIGSGNDFSEGFTVTIADKVYNGKKQISKPTIKYGKVTLKENKDYSISYSGPSMVGTDPVNPGRVTVTVTALSGGNFTGSAKTFYDISAKGTSISSFYVSKIPDQIYSGSSIAIEDISPYVVVKKTKNATDELVQGSPEGDDGDYYVRYASGANTKDVGTVNVEIIGRGIYSGRAKTSFKIVTKNVSACSIAVDDVVYNGTAQKPLVTVSCMLGGTPTQLVEGKDYTLTYSNNTKAGVKGSGKNAPKVTIKGKGSFTGSKEEGFTIERMPLGRSELSVTVNDIKSNGKTVAAKSVKSTITYYNNDLKKTVKLASGSDYDIVFTHDTTKQLQNAGFVLKGNYKNEGTIEQEFVIYRTQTSLVEARDVGSLEIIANTDNITYTGSAIKPSVVLKRSVDRKKITLVEGKDYSISYSNNTVAASKTDPKKPPMWKATGKGAYSGTISAAFDIDRRELTATEFYISVPDVKFNGKQQNPSVKVIERATGKAVSSSEYTVTYGSTLATTDDCAVVVTSKNKNYSGVLHGRFRVYSQPIKSAVIEKIANQDYTGEQIKPAVTVWSDKTKKTKLTEGVHYTLEYGTNVRTGKGTVTIKGIGTYGDFVTSTFQIVAKPM